jgi:hypothetical protein
MSQAHISSRAVGQVKLSSMCWDALTLGGLSGKGKRRVLGEKEESQMCMVYLVLVNFDRSLEGQEQFEINNKRQGQ